VAMRLRPTQGKFYSWDCHYIAYINSQQENKYSHRLRTGIHPFSMAFLSSMKMKEHVCASPQHTDTCRYHILRLIMWSGVTTETGVNIGETDKELSC